MKRIVKILCWLLILAFSNIGAAEVGGVKINGFLSVLATQTVNDDDIAYNHGMAEDKLTLDTFEDRLGIQISGNISENIKATAELLARGGHNFHYNVEVDWAYADLQAADWLNLHVGKYKIPQFIVSDFANVGFAYPWVRPPQEVYSVNPILSLSGVKILFTQPIKNSQLIFQAFYGEGSHDVFPPSRSIDANPNLPQEQKEIIKTKVVKIDTTDTVGGNLMLRSDSFSLRVGYFQTDLSAEALNVKNKSGTISTAGLSMDWHDIILYAEFLSRDAKDPNTQVFPDQHAGYTTLGYRISSFLPYYTFAKIDKGEVSSDLAIEQTSHALGFRFELSDSSALKFESLYAKPEEGNHGLFHTPVEDGMVYSMSVDVIF